MTRHYATGNILNTNGQDPHSQIKMEQKVADGCVQRLLTEGGKPVVILRRRLVVQTETCVRTHGGQCLSPAEELAPRLWLGADAGEDAEFTFTQNKVMLEATTLLHTSYGHLRCVPDAEYALWSKAGLCQVAPLVIHLDDVLWRVIASQDATAADDNSVIKLPDDMHPAMKLYLQAYRDGGILLEQVKEATSRGEKDLSDHREFLFKVFSIVSMPPTLSHDLSKTRLVNFCLGRCFTSDDLPVLQSAVPFDDCMSLVRKLHLEVENHHPEHGARPAISVLDMYLDRVSRGVQKTHGWNNAAWNIPERFAPAEYRQDFADLEQKYGHLKLSDPGELNFPTLLPGARLDVKWQDVVTTEVCAVA